MAGRNSIVDEAGAREIDARGANCNCGQVTPFDQRVCAAAKRRLINQCGIDPKENREFRESIERRNRSRRRADARRKPPRRPPRRPIFERDKTWKDEHCYDLLFNLRPDNLANVSEQLEQGAAEMLGDLKDLEDMLMEGVTDMVQDRAVRTAGRGAVRAVGCARAGPFAWACVIGSLAYSAYEVYDIYSSAQDMMGELDLDRLQQIRDRLQSSASQAEEISRIARSGDQQAIDDLLQRTADQMQEAITNDPCLQARRCYLLPYGASESSEMTRAGAQGDYDGRRTPPSAQAGTHDLAGRLGMADPRGCCPGQTAHHLVPDAWLRPGPGARITGETVCEGYDDAKAPTACVEGFGHSVGTHKQAHDRIEELLEDHMSRNDSLSMDQAVDIAAEAYHSSLGGRCSKECIREQLRDYYKDLQCSPLRPVDRSGNPVGPGTPGEGEADPGGSYS